MLGIFLHFFKIKRYNFRWTSIYFVFTLNYVFFMGFAWIFPFFPLDFVRISLLNAVNAYFFFHCMIQWRTDVFLVFFSCFFYIFIRLFFYLFHFFKRLIAHSQWNKNKIKQKKIIIIVNKTIEKNNYIWNLFCYVLLL